MYCSAVNDRKTGLLVLKCQKQVGAAEHDGLGPLILTELPSDRKEHFSLLRRHARGDGHLNIVPVRGFQRFADGQYDFGVADTAVKTALHDGTCPDEPNSAQIHPS